jgi:hypothetical protein
MPVLGGFRVRVFSPSLTIYRLYFGSYPSAGFDLPLFWPWLRVLRPVLHPAAGVFLLHQIWF